MGLIQLPDSYSSDFRNPESKPINQVILKTGNSLVPHLLDSFDFINSFESNLARNNNLFLSSDTLKSVAKGEKGLDFNVGDFFASATGHELFNFSHEAFFVVNNTTSEPISSIAESPGDDTHDRNLYINSSGNFVFRIFDGAVKLATSTSTAVSGQKVELLGTADGTNIRLYVNGILEATTAAGNAFSGFATPEFVIGRGFAGGASSNVFSDAFVIYHRVYKKALNATEALSLARNKYQTIKLANPPIYFTPSVAPAVGRIMGGLAGEGGLAGRGGLAGAGGGMAG